MPAGCPAPPDLCLTVPPRWPPAPQRGAGAPGRAPPAPLLPGRVRGRPARVPRRAALAPGGEARRVALHCAAGPCHASRLAIPRTESGHHVSIMCTPILIPLRVLTPSYAPASPTTTPLTGSAGGAAAGGQPGAGGPHRCSRAHARRRGAAAAVWGAAGMPGSGGGRRRAQRGGGGGGAAGAQLLRAERHQASAVNGLQGVPGQRWGGLAGWSALRSLGTMPACPPASVASGGRQRGSDPVLAPQLQGRGPLPWGHPRGAAGRLHPPGVGPRRAGGHLPHLRCAACRCRVVRAAPPAA